MKFLNILLLLIVLTFTWKSFTGGMIVPEDVHVDLQDGIKKIITNYISEELPSADNIVFHKFWSESLGENKVKASFVYSFEDMDQDGKSRTMIEGYAILNKDLRVNENNDEEIEYWTFDELYILDQYIEYKEGLAVSVDPTSTQ
ncbi:MAG: hypothetical protein KDD50_13430 [Bdellovibrionales bacterium]|nr:hypothetical protein [Bdellovibrionales bacterium]